MWFNGILSPKQQNFRKKLKKANPNAAEIYRGIVEVLGQNYPERIPQSALSIRELLDELGAKRKPNLEKCDQTKRNKQRPLILKNLMDGDIGRRKIISYEDQDRVPELAQENGQELKKIYDWSQTVLHHGKKPKIKDVREKIERLEYLLESALTPHFKTITKIDKILKIRANKDNFRKLKPLLAHGPTSYNYFFRKASGDWLPFLESETYFKNLNCDINDGRPDSNYILVEYLIRIYREKPQQVFRIIQNALPKEKRKKALDVRILNDLASAAVNMSPKHGKTLASNMINARWIDTPYRNLLGEFIPKLMVKLADRRHRESLDLCKMLLCVKLGTAHYDDITNEHRKTGQDIDPVLEYHDYKTTLEDHVPIMYDRFRSEIIELLVEKLENIIYLGNKSRNKKQSDEDESGAWRPSIRNQHVRHDYNLKSLLVHTIANLLTSNKSKSESTIRKELAFQNKNEYSIFKRLKLYSYGAFPKYFKKEIVQVAIQHFDDESVGPEYSDLLKENFPILPKKIQEKYFKLIEEGPKGELPKLWKKVLPEKIQMENVEMWKKKKLRPILNNLSEKDLQRFGKLATEMHDMPKFEFSPRVRMQELQTNLADDLDPDDVIAFIESYTFKKQRPHYNDTAYKFQKYVSSKPLEFSRMAHRLQDVESVFTSAMFCGLRDAIENERGEIDWKEVLALCEFIIKVAKNERDARTAEEVLGHMADLLRVGLNRNSISHDLRKTVWDLLSMLILFEDDVLGVEYDHEAQLDYNRVSIDTLSKKTLRAIMSYAIWHSNNQLNGKKPRLPTEVKRLLSDYFNNNISNSASRHEILGMYFLELIQLDRKWTIKNISKLFQHEQGELSRAAWNSYLARDYEPYVFEKLYDNYHQHVITLKDIKLDDEGKLTMPDRELVKNVIIAYCFGTSRGEKLFNMILEYGHEAVLSYCVTCIATVLEEQKGNPSKFNIKAMKSIWTDDKLSGNGNIWAWVRHTPFTKNETMKLIIKSLEKKDIITTIPTNLIEDLKPYTESHPPKTIYCLKLLMGKDVANQKMHQRIKSEVEEILGILYKNEDKDVAREAELLRGNLENTWPLMNART